MFMINRYVWYKSIPKSRNHAIEMWSPQVVHAEVVPARLIRLRRVTLGFYNACLEARQLRRLIRKAMLNILRGYIAVLPVSRLQD